MGRLGNNMFQIATVYGTAERYNEKPEFPPFNYFNLPKLTGTIKNYFKPTDNINLLVDIPHLPDLCLQGFFQRHQYFDNIKEKLIKEVFKVPIDYQPKTIAVHVRRGDFLYPVNQKHFPVQPVSYYMGALNKIGYKDKKVVFCSDDIDWCRENFSNLPKVSFREDRDPLDDIYFMANCDAVVMANSTFSFWGAYLNMRKRPVYFPLNWFAYDSGRDGKEICLDEWIGM